MWRLGDATSIVSALPCWLRLDLCNMSNEVARHGLARPYDARMQSALVLAARDLMFSLKGVANTACAAFVEGDEVSIVFNGPCTPLPLHLPPPPSAVSHFSPLQVC